MSDRVRTKLSFIIIEVADPKSGETQFVLQLNKHLNGYSFFGGHVEKNETAKEAAIRELKEELQIEGEELAKRWSYDDGITIDSNEINRIDDQVEILSDTLNLPFRSLRAERDRLPVEKNAEIAFSKFRVDPKSFPGIYKRLNNLLTTKFTKYRDKQIDSFKGSCICKSFTTNNLVEEAWSNEDNPFIRFCLKSGVIPFPEDKKKAPHFVFNTPAVECRLQNEIDKILELVFPNEALDIHILPPVENSIKYHIQSNMTLNSTIELRRSGSAKVARITFPIPYHGVFLLRPKHGHKISKWIWHSRMMAKPGLHKIIKYKNKSGDKVIQKWFLLSFMQGKYVEIEADKLEPIKETTTKRLIKKLPKIIFSSNPLYNTNEQHTHPVVLRNQADRNKYFQTFINMCKESIKEQESWLDAQDISYQRLNTYSNYLVEKYLTIIIKKCFSIRKGDKNKDAKWENICTVQSIINIKSLRKIGYFQLFEPLNLIDAISGLTSFQRYDYKATVLEQLPAISRQNHPSFRGSVCPVETPESKKVGLTLHTARNVKTDACGWLYKSDKVAADSDLGYAASLVPFYQHNDAARSMMGAKNLKQALTIKEAHTPNIITGNEQELVDLAFPLIEQGLIQDDFKEYKPGVDLLVAYMPWYGWNFEDAIVANERLKEKMKWEDNNEYSVYIRPEYNLCTPDPENAFAKAFISLFYENNFYKIGNEVTPDTEIAFFEKDGKKYPILCGGEDQGELVEIAYEEPKYSSMGGKLSWKVKVSKPLMIGDKLMGRHGNKGVISLLLPDDKLPKLPDDNRLPVELRGRAVDLVLNPHGVISRMNLGQLLETHIGLLQQFPNYDKQIRHDIGKAFEKIDLEELKGMFREINKGKKGNIIDENGRIKLVLPNGEETKQTVVVGYQHIVRLNHIPDRKYQVRSGGSGSKNLYNLVTGQPVRGRKNRGGQRIGEMEMWALYAQMAHKNIRSILQTKSDPLFGKNSGKLPSESGQTFYAINDHLLALGIISTKTAQGKEIFKWDYESKYIRSIGKHLENHETWRIATTSDFKCPTCGIIYKNIEATGEVKRSNKVILIVKDVLNAGGHTLINSSKEITSDRGSGEIQIRLTENKRKTKIQYKYDRNKGGINLSFEYNGEKHYAYKKLGTIKDGSKPQQIVESDINNFWVVCENHKSKYLTREHNTLYPAAVPGGLCDENIFGSINLEKLSEQRWGYFKLPFKIDYPINIPQEYIDKAPQIQYVPILPLKYRYNKPNMEKVTYGGKLTELYSKLITKCKAYNGNSAVHKREIINLVKSIYAWNYKALFGVDPRTKEGESKQGLIRRKGLGRRVDYSGRLVIVPDPDLAWNECGVPTETLLVLLKDEITNIIAKYGSSTAPINELINSIFKSDLPEFSTNDLEAMPDVVNDIIYDERNKAFLTTQDKTMVLKNIQDLFTLYFNDNKEFRILLNRQPSLHKYNILAFKPVPLLPEDGMVLKINPLVCKAFAADFDGDEMAIHMPLTLEEHKEAQQLEPTNPRQLISVADNKALANISQDIVLGNYLLNRKGEPALYKDGENYEILKQIIEKYLKLDMKKESQLYKDKKSYKTLEWVNKKYPKLNKKEETQLYQDEESLGILKPIFEKHLKLDTKEESRLYKDKKCYKTLEQIIEEYSKDVKDVFQGWMNNLFELITEEGASFGMLELTNFIPPKKIINGIIRDNREKPQEINKLFVLKTMQKLQKDTSSSFVDMAISGARGNKQVRQLVTARGYLSPGDIGFKSAPAQFRFNDSLLSGMTPEASFYAAMNARSSMVDKKKGTPKAGYLTRRMVLALWPWVIGVDDCNTEKQPAICNCKLLKHKKICAKCYGSVFGYEKLPADYPVGLIAAQSIGERGTQLSMQSFHTGERAMSLSDVEKILNGKDPDPVKDDNYNWFTKPSNRVGFVKRMKNISAYKDILDRHFELLWIAIHNSKNNTLTSAWDSVKTPISLLAGSNQWRGLLEAIDCELEEDYTNPLASLLLGKAPFKEGEG